MIHLEGMGVLGCYLATRLHEDGVPFTWNDTEERVTAWRACTGAIFPTGLADDRWAMMVWRSHLHSGWPWLEQADYVYCTKAPPHGGRYVHTPLAGEVKVGVVPSLHLNAQAWVPWTRLRFMANERPWPDRGTRPRDPHQLVITHGFGYRLHRYMWGWTVPVRIKTTATSELRPAVYLRRGRFVMAYAYPIPGTDQWYAGSSLISQREPRSLTIGPKFERWCEQFLELGAGYILSVEPAGQPVEGWRPVPALDDQEWVSRTPGGALAVKPLWHSGVRHAPHVYAALKEALS